MINVTKKKRGRKPKNKIVINDNPVFENKNKVDNLIACISYKKIEYDNENELNGFKGEDKNEQNNQNYSYIPEEENIPLNEKKITTNNKFKCCWNCSFDIKNQPISFPIKYNNGLFYTNGDFCTFECAGRYLLDNYKNKELWEKYTLLNYYHNKIKNDNNNDNKVKIAPSKLRLIKFGGDLEYEEYINSSSYNYNDNYIPPVIHVNHIFHKYESSNILDNNDLKIYRKKSINKDTIFNKMK